MTKPEITPQEAYDYLKALPGAKDHTKGSKAYTLSFPGKLPRDIAVRMSGGTRGLTIDLNQLSCNGLPLDDACLRAEVEGRLLIRRQSFKQAGEKLEMSSRAAQLPTLNPRSNETLWVQTGSRQAFEALAAWYTGAAAASGVAQGSPTVADMEDAQAVVPASVHAHPGPHVAIAQGRTGTAPDEAAAADVRPTPDAGFFLDSVARRLVERCAVDRAIEVYAALKFNVIDCGSHQSYDLECRPTEESDPGTPVVHVEIKGTQGSGLGGITLTANEVEHARAAVRDGYRSDLFVLGDIELPADPHAAGAKATSRANPLRIENWLPEDKDLKPTVFRYQLPSAP